MTHWYEGPLAALSLRATGPDTEADRLVTAALVVQDLAGARPRTLRWLVSPGVAMTEEQAARLGLTHDQVVRTGRWPAPVMEEVGRALAGHAAAGRPLVVDDAPAALTLLDRELRRHRASSLGAYLSGVPLSVLDPRVLDTELDRYRKGSRHLDALCVRYGVPAPEPHDAADQARVAVEVVRALARVFAPRLERLTPGELHALQEDWHAAQVRHGPGPAVREGTAGGWPLRPRAAAAV
ncbi:3'-5' exonuclease family protein [Streptomyces diastaticus]|uniref:3'-5' exonuclease n=1 Tax=Streptomyces diastaticus TaxID=1956 RepID=UPI00365595E5